MIVSPTNERYFIVYFTKISMKKLLLSLVFIITFLVCTQQFAFYILNEDQFSFFSLDSFSKCPEPNNQTELLAGDMVSGKITTKYPNFGILAVRFHNHNRDSDDTLSFRIKPINSDDWYYRAEYKTDQFQPHQHFPFGFPTIYDSKDQTYQYEIESLRGERGKGIALDCQPPSVIGKSVFTKSDFTNTKLLSIFIIDKGVTILANPVMRQNLLIFYTPLLLLLIHLLTYKQPVLLHFIAALALSSIDIIFINTINSYLIFAILFFWILTAFRIRFDPRIYTVLAILLLTLVPVMLICGLDLIAEKISIWIYLLLTISVIQIVFQLKGLYKPKISLKQIYTNFTHK